MTITELESIASVGTDLPTEPGGSRRERRLAAESAAKPTRALRRTSPVPAPSAPATATSAIADPLADEADAPRRTRAPLTPLRGTIAWVLATVSLLCLWFVAYAVVLTPFQESSRQTVLYSTLREQLAQQVAPLGGDIKPGSPVALLNSASLGISDAVIVEGTSSGDLMSGPGHKSDTVLPGQAGVSVLYGRATLFGGPFAQLVHARVGDTITVVTGQGTFTYVISGLRRGGDPFPEPVASGGGRLTLVTAEGSGRLGALSPHGVVYVDATLKGQGQPSPGHPATVPLAEQAMQGDPSALLPLAVLLPLLVGSIVLVVWTRVRWGGWQTWVIGAPLVLAALWGVSQCAVQLLPNLL
jgi:sortase A